VTRVKARAVSLKMWGRSTAIDSLRLAVRLFRVKVWVVCLVSLRLATALAQASFSFDVTNPWVGSVNEDNLYVQVGVTSTYEVQSVTATVADRATNLMYDANLGWTNNLALAGLARGTQTIAIVATDFLGNSGQTNISFVHDQPPVLTVIEPAAPLMVRPQFRVKASATDDDPKGAVIKASVLEHLGLRPLAMATNTLDAVVDISEFDGYTATLEFDAIDSVGHNVATQVNVFVCSNTNVFEVDRVSGTIRDVSPDRILSTLGDLYASSNVLMIKSRSTGIETVLVDRPDLTWHPGSDQAFLTPHGAIFTSAQELYEASPGTIIDLGPCQQHSLAVKGNYAIWTTDTTLIRRDLLAGTNFLIYTNAAGSPAGSDVAANGDVVYSGVYRYRSGITTLVGSGVFPLTDGVNVGYFQGSAYPFSGFALFDGTNETILSPQAWNSGSSPELASGWTAFTKPGTGGTTQAWTRSPSGVQSQRTLFGDPSEAVYLQGLASNGDIMFILQGLSALSIGRLYFAPAWAAPQDLATPKSFGNWAFNAQPFWLEGNWYASMGGSLVSFIVPATVAISSPAMAPTGQFSFHVIAGIGQQIITQQSSDLATWVSVSTNYVTGTSGLQVAVPATGNSSKQFYRVVSVQ